MENMENITQRLSCVESELEKMRLEVCSRPAICTDLSTECSTMSGTGGRVEAIKNRRLQKRNF